MSNVLIDNAQLADSLFQIMVQYIDSTAFFGIDARKAMWTWIAIDFCTLVIQATGGGLAATAGADVSRLSICRQDNLTLTSIKQQNLFTIGSHVMLAGIILQLAVAIIFSVVALVYFKRIYRRAFDGHGHAGPDISLRIRDPVGRFVWGLGVIQGCIIARSVSNKRALNVQFPDRLPAEVSTGSPNWQGGSTAL